MINRILVTAAIATLPLATWVKAQDKSDILPSAYCIRYFGGIRANVDVPDAIPKFSLNDEFRCPRSWDFPRTEGAIFELCPPDLSPRFEGEAMTASLRIGDTYLDRPIDGLRFMGMYITNGSVEGPFENNGQPAIIVEDPKESKEWSGAWFVNGTEDAFIDDPDADDKTWAVELDCQYLNSTDRFCAYEYPSPQDIEAVSACWVQQTFPFNMETPLNFSIWFTSDEAKVDIWSESEYIANYNRTGSNSKVTLHFTGDRIMPTVTDDEFWDNSPRTYEDVQATLNQDMRFERDNRGFPLFWNGSSNKEWYSARNGTYQVENHATRREPENLIWSALLMAVFLATWMGGVLPA